MPAPILKRFFGLLGAIVLSIGLGGCTLPPLNQPINDGAELSDAPAAPTTLNRRGVRESQRLLRQLGYKPGGVDGIVGRRTQTAARAFQADIGVPVDGGLTPDLLDQLRASAAIDVDAQSKAEVAKAVAPPPPANEKLRRRGIRESQRLLRKLGYRPGGADGIPGRRTRAAVRAYQADLGLFPDGELTTGLLEKLRTSATIAASQPSRAPSAEVMATETGAPKS